MTFLAPSIKSGKAADREQMIATMTVAFAADPMARWIYPDPLRFLKHYPTAMRAFSSRSFEQGTAHYVSDHAGVALWLPPGVGLDEVVIGEVMAQILTNEAEQEAVFNLTEQTAKFHPQEPFWYLLAMGVDPKWQGQGLGSALLEHVLALCDRDQQLVYTESSNPRNLPLYQRHGFEVIGEIQVHESPSTWPILRKPR